MGVENETYYRVDLLTGDISTHSEANWVTLPNMPPASWNYIESPSKTKYVYLRCDTENYANDRKNCQDGIGHEWVIYNSSTDSILNPISLFAGDFSDLPNDWHGSWSPDERFIAYVIFKRFAIYDIAIYSIIEPSINSSILRVLSPIRWSPDGKSNAFFYDAIDGDTYLTLLEVESDTVQNIPVAFDFWTSISSAFYWDLDGSNIIANESGRLISIAPDGTITPLDQDIETLLVWHPSTVRQNTDADNDSDETGMIDP